MLRWEPSAVKDQMAARLFWLQWRLAAIEPLIVKRKLRCDSLSWNDEQAFVDVQGSNPASPCHLVGAASCYGIVAGLPSGGIAVIYGSAA